MAKNVDFDIPYLDGNMPPQTEGIQFIRLYRQGASSVVAQTYKIELDEDYDGDGNDRLMVVEYNPIYDEYDYDNWEDLDDWFYGLPNKHSHFVWSNPFYREPSER